MPGPLANDRHERFCHEYLKDLVAGRAYERAGYKAKGKSADEAASVLLSRNLKVQARIAELKEERKERVQIEADTVLRELLILATSSVNHYTVDEDGRIELLDDAPDHAERAVSSVKITRTPKPGQGDEIKTEYRLWDKNSALDKLAKHLGLYEQHNRQKTPDVIRWELRTANHDTDDD